MKPAFSDLSEATVAIVGLGLMGGSLAGRLTIRRACKMTIGVARRQESLDTAFSRGWIDAGFTDLAEGVADADLVILATPPRVVLQQLQIIGPLLPDGCVLTDLASTKSAIVRAMNDLPAHVYPLGGHPMCGKEQAGLDAASPDLYEHQLFVLAPLARTPRSAVELARSMVAAAGAEPLVLDPAAHDRMVAWISHLPHLTAVALMRAALAGAEGDPDLWSLAAGGFRDGTRLAASSREMMLDIFLTNKEPILAAAQRFQAELAELCHLLECGDEVALARHLDEAISRRREMG